MCPIYLLIVAPIVFKESIKSYHIASILLGFLGLFATLIPSFEAGGSSSVGIIFGLISGVLYAVIVLINRRRDASSSPIYTTTIQMASSALVLLPLAVIEGDLLRISDIGLTNLALIVLLGLVHTGLGFLVYFGTFRALATVQIALISYLEPVSAIVLAAIVIGDMPTIYQTIGAIGILSATGFSELYPRIKLKLDTSRQFG